jgi:hypothetical protein
MSVYMVMRGPLGGLGAVLSVHHSLTGAHRFAAQATSPGSWLVVEPTHSYELVRWQNETEWMSISIMQVRR